jgi:hypothetical protein
VNEPLTYGKAFNCVPLNAVPQVALVQRNRERCAGRGIAVDVRRLRRRQRTTAAGNGHTHRRSRYPAARRAERAEGESPAPLPPEADAVPVVPYVTLPGAVTVRVIWFAYFSLTVNGALTDDAL